MKPIVLLLPAIFLSFAANARKYDAFTSEAKGGLDYVAVESLEYMPDGDLGREIYPAKQARSEYDIFIPTTNYVRLGMGASFGFAGSPFMLNGGKVRHDFGLSEIMAIGWNLSSFVRSEFGWRHSDMRFPGAIRTDADIAHLKLYFDLARRYVLSGDVYYRRIIIPFIGFGGGGGWIEFGDAGAIPGRSGFAYGANAEIGISFAFSDTNAIDIAVGSEYLRGGGFGWDDPLKSFLNTSATLSWRSSF